MERLDKAIRFDIKRLSTVGFSALELLYALVLFAFLIYMANSLVNTNNQNKQYNQLADQIHHFSNVAIKYLTDNYRALAKKAIINDQVIPYSSMLEYDTSNMASNGLSHCLYITNGGNGTIRAYLFFANAFLKAKPLSFLAILKVAQNLGGNAGILVQGNGGYMIQGNVSSNLLFPKSTINSIGLTCGFSNNTIPINSIVINLSEDKNLFPALQTTMDKQASDGTLDPSLKRVGKDDFITMQTNLYLDNVVKESFTLTNFYCDSNRLPQNDANNICLNYASNNGYTMYPGTASWIQSILSGTGQTCIATAQANFYKETTTYSCNGVNFPNANSVCPAIIGNQNQVLGLAYWSPNPGQLSGNQCISNAYAYYKNPSSCVISCGGNSYDPKCFNLIVQYGTDPIIPHGCGFAWDYTLHGSYNPSNEQCAISIAVIGFCSIRNTTMYVPAWVADDGGGGINSSPTYCGQQTMPALSSQSPVNQGYLQCTNTATYTAFESVVGVPAQHRYRAIDFGPGPIDGQRIQAISAAPSGPAITTSQLNINNAGLQAGFISPISEVITPGLVCNSTDLGKMAQEQFSSIVGAGGQLQCAYNPTFCPGLGYCYLPVKSAGVTYTYLTPQQLGQCPPGSLVDVNQPANNIDAAIFCPVEPGWTIIQGVHGKPTNCYSSITGFSFCPDYQTVCTYANNNGDTKEVKVAALLALQCSTSTTTFTLNYSPSY